MRVYALHMLKERLQILVTADQRRRLELEARRSGVSVGSLVRDAVDARFGSITLEERRRALNEMRAMNGRFVQPDELDRIVEKEREQNFPDDSASAAR